MRLAGEGAEKDVGSALHWYGKATEGGSSGGMYGLGMMILEGAGTDKDEARAEALFRAASERGCSKAMYAPGEIPERRGLTEEAFGFYVQGAAKGEPRCVLRTESRNPP